MNLNMNEATKEELGKSRMSHCKHARIDTTAAGDIYHGYSNTHTHIYIYIICDVVEYIYNI